MKQTIPFSILPPQIMKILAKPFYGLGYTLGKGFPYLKIELKQAELDFNIEEYSAIMVLNFVIYFLLFSVFGSIFLSRMMGPGKYFVLAGFQISEGVPVGLTIGLVGAFLVFIQMSMYPKIQIKKKIRSIEANLVYGLRTMLVQLKSGISLFNTINMVANGNFGQLSIEFKKAIDEINTGVTQEAALQHIAINNPSSYVRKTVWQVVNGMKAGADVADVIEESVSSMIREQEIEIQKYGSSLRMLSLVYLMIGIIIPALGLTFLIVLGSFPKIQITQLLFWILLGSLMVAEFMFLGIIKSKRPNLMSA